MTLTWNIVTKRITPHEQLQEKFRQKIAKLETHLQLFPPDAVHLQIKLERQVRKPVFTASLTLRVPSNILHGEKQAGDPVTAFDQAMKALLRELGSLKAELRRERRWHRLEPRVKQTERLAARFTAQPLPGGAGPQSLADIVSGFLQLNHARLLRYISRQIAHRETTGEVQARALDARAVLDEVARQVLTAPGRKPARLSYPLWLYSLARRELARRWKQLRSQAEDFSPLRRRVRLPDDLNDQERSVEEVEKQFEPAGLDTEDWMADERVTGPDTAAASRDLLKHLQQVASRWPQSEREVFELYFVEGFDTDEIALVEKTTPAQVRSVIETVQNRLRESVLEAAEGFVPQPTRQAPAPAKLALRAG